MNKPITVLYGPNEVAFDTIAGKRVGSIRKALRGIIGIPDLADAFVNGTPVSEVHLLQPGDILSFIPKGCGTKRALEPDELEGFVRRIDSNVKKLADEGVFTLRLNSTEKDIFKALQSGPLKGDTLAKKIDRTFDANLKATLAALVRHGLLDNSDEGYFVPPAVQRYLKSTGAV